ncbi:MAG: porin [Gemmatimonadetes bacterium]|nr:porin [Gemmatimonadota bacterium]
MATAKTRHAWRAGAAIAALALLNAPALRAQETGTRVVPTHQTVITGYGTVGYAFETQGENKNAFTSSVNPIFLFQFMDKVLFEVEFEFELEGGITETGLEYAQLDVLLTDNITLVGGKFLLPFGVFGERLHPTWINKFATSPPIYGHHVAAFGAEPLLPILSDVGFMARGTVTPGRWNLSLNAFVTQGPDVEAGGDPAEPELVFPGSSEDNNTNKMLGGRVDISLPPWFEINGSLINGDYDTNNFLDFTAWNVAGELRLKNVEIRGEYLQTRLEIETATGFPTIRRHGFYAQAAYRVGPFEPVFRWTQVFDTREDGVVTAEDGAWQAGFGIDYWFSPSIVLMAGFELNREDGLPIDEIDNDRLVAHIAFGF